MTKSIRFLTLDYAPLMFLTYFIRYFFISLFIFSGIFFVFSFIQIINDNDVVNGISFYYLSKAIIYLLPSIISQTLGFSIVFSIFFSVGELSSKGELIALRVGGYSYYEITKLFFLFVFVLTVFLYFLNNNIVPKYRLKSKEYIRTMMDKITNITIKKNSFDSISSFTIYASEVNDNEMKGVSLYRNITNKYNSDFFATIYARTGYYSLIHEKGIKVTLNDGNISNINKKNYFVFYTGRFKQYSTFIPFEIRTKNYSNPPQYYPTSYLKEQIIKETDNKKIFKIKSEIISRITSTLSIILFSIISIILAMIVERNSKYFSFLISSGIIVFYYTSTILCEFISKKNNNLFPFINFAPSIIILISCIYAYYYKLRFR